VVVLFALGLLCKPNLVTLPFVLLLLDYWPLRRLGGVAAPGGKLANQQGGFPVFAHLVLEKIPLFVLSAAASVIAPMAEGKAMTSLAGVPFLARMSNPIMSYVTYLRQTVYPADLAPFYPYSAQDFPGWTIILALMLLVAISAVALAAWQKHPYLLVGWLWYLGVMVPMIGIMQVGSCAHADRYTYLPMIGLSIALTWAAADLCAGWRHRRLVLGGLATAILAALIFCARIQTSYWRNGELLWTHTLACTSGNYVAHNNLGIALLQKGSVDEAIVHYQKALQIKPDYSDAHDNLGNALLQKGSVDEAIAHFQKALQLKPDNAETHYNLGNAMFQKGSVDEAIAHFQKTLQFKPNYADAHNNLGNALLQKGSVDEAVTHFQKALQINPNYANAHINLGNILLEKGSVDEAIAQYQKALQIEPDSAVVHNNLGYALLQKGSVDEAIVHYQKALGINPGYTEALNNLAWVLATSSQASLRNGGKAVELAQRANQLTGGENPAILHTLAAAYAEAGRFNDALQSAQKAFELAKAAEQQDLVGQLDDELKLYQAGFPFHQESK
jgi:tetratricopeptide (TPR) repeat protein